MGGGKFGTLKKFLGAGGVGGVAGVAREDRTKIVRYRTISISETIVRFRTIYPQKRKIVRCLTIRHLTVRYRTIFNSH